MLFFASRIIESKYSDIDSNVKPFHFSKSLKFIEMAFDDFHRAVKSVSFPTFFILSSWAPFPSITGTLIHREILILAAYFLNSRLKDRLRVSSGMTVIGFTISFFQRWIKIRRYVVDCTCSPCFVNQCMHWRPGAASVILMLEPFLAAHIAGASSVLTQIRHFQSISWLTELGVM